jgi:hypothetical protein
MMMDNLTGKKRSQNFSRRFKRRKSKEFITSLPFIFFLSGSIYFPCCPDLQEFQGEAANFNL